MCTLKHFYLLMFLYKNIFNIRIFKYFMKYLNVKEGTRNSIFYFNFKHTLISLSTRILTFCFTWEQAQL